MPFSSTELWHLSVPLAIGKVLREHAIPEFHLTINLGNGISIWGHPGEPGVSSGAELCGWMGDNDGAQRETR